jgi:hypothetical protein
VVVVVVVVIDEEKPELQRAQQVGQTKHVNENALRQR